MLFEHTLSFALRRRVLSCNIDETALATIRVPEPAPNLCRVLDIERGKLSLTMFSMLLCFHHQVSLVSVRALHLGLTSRSCLQTAWRLSLSVSCKDRRNEAEDDEQKTGGCKVKVSVGHPGLSLPSSPSPLSCGRSPRTPPPILSSTSSPFIHHSSCRPRFDPGLASLFPAMGHVAAGRQADTPVSVRPR